MKRFSIPFSLLLMALVAACTTPTAVPTLTEMPATEVPSIETAPPAMPTTFPSTASADTSITVTDALNRDVKLPAQPHRIVFTGKALFMIVDAAYLFPGASEKIVALGSTAQGTGNFIQLVDKNYDQKAVLAKDAGAEQIAALQPDLVILKSYLADSLGTPIEALGIPVVYVDFETPAQYNRDLAILGKVFGDETRTTEIAAYYQDRMDALQATVKDLPKPRTLLLYYNDKDGNVAFNVPPMNWIQTQMVEMAGGEPVWADANPAGSWTQVTLEQIAAWDPDQIYLVAYSTDPEKVVEGLKADASWKKLTAVQKGQLYAFAGDLYSWDQPDPRWILGLTWLTGKIHPEALPALDMVTETKTFYSTLYGLDEAFFEKSIHPTFKGDLP